eukprot:TRINITY_DN930_c0_g1_i1.p1 TRINITY_DN930_c0_g1~~TRINITY_DN930_c0_g1_i1.p1  ORF type:complete len:176 (+),score=41.62 TRINITY_DN930_c0_g1_i1:56-583(+)
MSQVRRFNLDDLFHFNNVNLDVFTETFYIPFYCEYLERWPDFFSIIESADGQTMGYIMGKAEGNDIKWHGHVTAVTVGPEFRRLGLAKSMMDWLESVSEVIYDGYFVDLFVRKSNSVAVNMYKKFGYSIYRTVMGYYSGEEDAYDMRKALPRDVNKQSIIPLGRPIKPNELHSTL